MILRQYYLGCLAHASYLVADEESGIAAVVDPQRDVDQYVDDAAALGCTIRDVLLTHFHADFIAGHLELRDRVGARVHLGARAQAEYDFGPLARRRRPLPRASAARGAGDTWAFPGVDLDPRLRPGGRSRGALRRADGRHAVHRRRRASRPPRGARLERGGARAACCTTRCTRSSSPSPTRHSSTQPTAPAPCAASISARTPSPPSVSRGSTTTRCSR